MSVQRLAEFVVVKVISPLTTFVPMGKSASGVSSSADATDAVMITAIAKAVYFISLKPNVWAQCFASECWLILKHFQVSFQVLVLSFRALLANTLQPVVRRLEFIQ